MFGALKRGFRSMAGLILVRNVVGELRPKRTLAASRGFLAAARLSCLLYALISELQKPSNDTELDLRNKAKRTMFSQMFVLIIWFFSSCKT